MLVNEGKGSTPVDWQSDQYWRLRRLSPAQLQVHDVRLGYAARYAEGILEMREVLTSTLLPALEQRDRLADSIPVHDLTKSRSEQVHLKKLAFEYGWMNCLRSKGVQQQVNDPPELKKCRWIHISSKFSTYLSGCLLALSDWGQDPALIGAAMHQLEHCINQQERFSKHGRYFEPFFQYLLDGHNGVKREDGPMLLSVPFLDWSVEGTPPPLRFQIDPREGFQSSKSSSHLLRSILQYFYRLEDTTDRESQQVFTRHKPWQTDRDLDLKVRRWYGYYPKSLNVDELWILVIDARHVVTFSSNQSWKSRWPPLQLSARIMEISFRGVRNAIVNSTNSSSEQDYNSTTHVATVLNGALGMLHRSFWTDITLCLSDRYASYLGHLQYRLHRSPSTKLVMDLLQVQEELTIIESIMSQQIALVKGLQSALSTTSPYPQTHSINLNTDIPPEDPFSTPFPRKNTIPPSSLPTYRQFSTSTLSDPLSQLLQNLLHEHADLTSLSANSNALINRTIQLVNIRLEDHGKAILVFTIVTIIFLPLSFVSSFFGMNFADIRDMQRTQGLFWVVACALTAGTVLLSIFAAFYGGAILEAVVGWRERRRRLGRERRVVIGPRPERRGIASDKSTFEVLGVSRPSFVDLLTR